MARIDVIMPQMGESIAEGTLSKWLKAIGDDVRRDEPMFEISTDKVDAEIPAPAAGTLVEIKVQEGQTVPVQTVVAVLETQKSADGDAPPPSASPASAAGAPPASTPAPAPAATPREAAPSPASPPAREPAAAAAAQPAAPATKAPARTGDGAETADDRLRRLSTPLVRRIAAEHALDIASIPGTGHAGRVTKKDILEYIERRGTAPTAPPAAAEPRAAPAAAGAIVHPENEAWEGDRVEPMSRIRKLTADHMVHSRRVSAHVTTFQEVDLTRVAQARARLKQGYADRGVSLTFLAFIAKATVDMLRRYPVLNAAVSGDRIIYRGDVNLGIAVALDWGLIVPVIRRADDLSLLGLARAIQDLAERARAKKLQPDEIQRGTFTITNPGVFGSYIGTPIINQPQVAILGVGTIEKRPKVITLDDGQDVIAIRTMCMFAVTYDHRIVDGADAGKFMRDFRAALEQFPDEGV